MNLSRVLSALALLCMLAIGITYWSINHADNPSISELSQSINGAEDPSLHSQLIPDTDLPPEGTRSLFDHLIAQNDGLPYPFSDMIKLLQNQHPEGEAPLSLLIPDGRSLLKGQADHHLPRILIAPDFQEENTSAGLGMNAQGQLFVALVEGANEIEVLSYNEGAGRFEFQLVQNYCEGCVPRIVYAPRAICLTCHQGGGPIFSQRPWQETNGQLSVAKRIQAARGSEPYWGIGIEQPLAIPERFDELTDVGNFHVASQRVWLDACGLDGNECRRTLLSLALRYADQPGLFDPQSEEVKTLLKLWANTYPEAGIKVPQSDLANRDPSGESNSFTEWLYAALTPDISFGDGAKDNEDLNAFEKLPPLPPRQDPLTLRAPKQTLTSVDIDGVYGIASFFTESDLKALNASYGYKIETILKRVADLPIDFFDAKPFSRVKVMQALLDSELQYCCLDTSEMSPPRVSSAPKLEINEHQELKLFEQYCFTCHRGNPAKRLDFMSGDNEQIVLDKIKDKAEIRDVLDWERYQNTDKESTLMPPRDSVQYKKLVDALNKGGQEGDELQQMRESVPSLFSF
jgi:hypothetical protein